MPCHNRALFRTGVDMSSTTVADERKKAFRRTINGLMAIEAIDARELFAQGHTAINTTVSLQMLTDIYTTVGRVDLGRDGMIEHASQSPALKQLKKDTGAVLVNGYHYGYCFTGDE